MDQPEGFLPMLILTRQFQEAIIIGDNITVTVLGVDGGQVKLGIDAPRDMTVLREELYQDRQLASSPTDD